MTKPEPGRAKYHIAAAVICLLAMLVAPAQAAASRKAMVLEASGIIGPAMADYLTRAVAAADPLDTGLIILRMDTPGGLDASMREIIRVILASPIPIATYVAPAGARAASAGTYIAYACAIVAMAPGTNLGAATPIEFGAPPAQSGTPSPSSPTVAPEPADTETRKIINDAEAYIRSLASLNGRNGDWAAKAVREAVSLPADEALRLHVIDVIAADIPDLLRQADGRSVMVAGKRMPLMTRDLEVVVMPPDWRTRLLGILANPNVAYILLLIGAYGLFFEFANPGTVAPGITGGISLLIALFALNMLPVDYAGAGLLLLGLALMVAEAFIGSFGIIGIGGVVAFTIGSLLMFRTNAAGFGLSLSVVIAATVVSAGFFLLVLAMLLRSRRRPVVTGQEALIGAEGEAIAWQGGQGRVRVKGEIWQARAPHPLEAGMRVKIVGRDGLFLFVERL